MLMCSSWAEARVVVAELTARPVTEAAVLEG
jgi:hypothetical protein